MKNDSEFKLDVISKIDEEIIDRATTKRDKLLKRPMLSLKKRIISFGSMAAIFVLAISSIFMFVIKDDKQIPIYTGMTVSDYNPMLNQGGDMTSSLSASGGGSLEDGPLGQEPPRYHGDCKGDDAIDKEKPFGDGKKPIEEAVDSAIAITPGEDIYYANPGEDVYITIHIDNPDGFEILSFTLNGNKYSSYMFEYGSDLENLILKVNVGDATGRVEYTIDQIKYIDGTEIKDVKMEGDKTVSIGVYTDNQPKIEIADLKTTLSSISFIASVKDEMNLISLCGGKAQAVLYDGEEIIAVKDITEKNQRITFGGLKQDTVYQYAVVVTYDKLDGKGLSAYTLFKDSLYTEAPLLFDSVEVTKVGISFKYLWYSELAEKKIESVMLYLGNEKVRNIEKNDLSVDNLLSDTEYKLVTVYKNGEKTESIELIFKTLEKEMPVLEIKDITKDKSSISFELGETDIDNIGNVTKIQLLLDKTVVADADDLSVRGFTELLAGNIYTLSVTYVYDLNDGRGEQTVIQIAEIVTDNYEKPTVELKSNGVTSTSIAFKCTFADPDGVGKITRLELIRGEAKLEAEDLTVREFTNLLSNSAYVIKVTYVYDLKDGRGEVTDVSMIELVTKEKTAPTVEISNVRNNGASFKFNVALNDADGIGEITSIKLFRGEDELASSDVKSTVEFSIPSARTEYKAKVIYTYDLNDGKGAHTEEVIVSSWTPSEGLETDDGGNVIGIGECIDKILFIDKPILGNAFEGNINIEEVYFLDGATTIGGFTNCMKLKFVYVGEGVVTVSSQAFENCVSLEGVYFSSTVKNIYYAAFQSCSRLASVTFHDDIKLTSIDSWSFAKCSLLRSFCIPDSVVSIGYSAFSHSGLISVTFGEDNNVTSIGEGAFEHCEYLESFIVPKGVTILEPDVFSHCKSLKNMVVPKGVTAVKRGAFWYCDALTWVVVSDTVLIMGENVFEGCYNAVIFLEGSEVPSTWLMRWNPHNRPIVLNADKYTYTFETNGGSEVEDITDYSVTVSPKITKEGCIFMGWYDNAELTGDPVKFPYYNSENTTLYAGWLDPEELTESEGLLVDNGVVKGIGTCTDKVLFINKPVGSFAFDNCDTISTVILGAGVTEVSGNAFQNCDKLEMIVFASDTIPEIGPYVFGGSWYKANFTVYVPESTYDYYRNCSAEHWQESIVWEGKLIAY